MHRLRERAGLRDKLLRECEIRLAFGEYSSSKSLSRDQAVLELAIRSSDGGRPRKGRPLKQRYSVSGQFLGALGENALVPGTTARTM